MQNKIIQTYSEQQTIQFAQKFVAQLGGGCVLGLVGELGAGKTQFVKGLARGLDIKQPITSPTFVLLKEYRIKNNELRIKDKGQKKLPITHYSLPITKFVHIDCYRLTSPEELWELGLTEYLQDQRALIAIEWADKIKEVLTKNTIWIELRRHQAKNKRQIKIRSDEIILI